MLSELVKVEKIEVDDHKIDAAIEKTSVPFGDSAEKIREMLQKESGRRSLELDLISDKALTRLQDIAKGDTIEVSEPDVGTVKDSVTVKDEPSTEAGNEEGASRSI